MWWFQLPYHKHSVPEEQYSIFASLWCFISHLIWYARAYSSYECFILRQRGFHLSSSHRDTSWNVFNRPSGSFMVDMGISSNFMKSPSPTLQNFTWHSGTWPYTMTPSIDQTLHQFANFIPNSTLLPILNLLLNFGGFHRTFQRVQLVNKGRLLLRNLVLSHLGLAFVFNVETILSWTCHVYWPFEFRTSLGTSSLLTYISTDTFVVWRSNSRAS